MIDKKTSEPEELTEAELDTVAGGTVLTTNENITEFSKKGGGKTAGSLKERLSDGTGIRRQDPFD